MKCLEDLRDKYKGEEIWVIGAGLSLEEYPLDFFKDKICIGVNWVFSVFLDIGDGIDKFETRIFHSVHSHRQPADWIAKHIPHFLKMCFFILSPQSRRVVQGRPYCYVEGFNDDPYWIRNSWQHGNTKASRETFKAMAKNIMAKKDGCRYFCRGTTLHWAISVAVVLGAKKIYVVGAEGIDGRISKHGSLYPSIYTEVYRKFHQGLWRGGTKHLAEAFEPYGINIVYHRYNKGEQKP